MSQDIVETLKQGTMKPVQVLAVTICVVINMLDGFDVLVMAFTAPSISAEWALNPQSLGVLFSSGLFGMAAGSLFIAPLADRMGRRNIILICLVIISVGMLASAFTNSIFELAAMRVITGLGIGGALASITTITAEYSSKKRQGFAISLVQSGYPIGATIGGTIAAILIVQYGWRSVFIFGAICSALMIPMVLRFLPESLEYLITHRPKNALGKINSLLSKLDQPTLQQLPESKKQIDKNNGLLKVIAPELRASTLLLWCAFFMVMLSFYFVLSWTPTLLTEAGLRIEQGISGAVLMNIGGVIGGISLGYLTSRFSRYRLTAFFMTLCAIAMIGFGLLDNSLNLMLIVGFVIGYFVFGSMIGLYSIAPDLYHTSIRNTGMGWAIGIGRIGAIIGPSAAGFLLNRGWSGADCFIAFSLPLLVAMMAIITLNNLRKNQAATVAASSA
jgi:benzoate transport